MRWRATIAVFLGLLMLLAVVAVDVVFPPPEPTPPAEVEAAAITPVAGSVTCAVGDGRQGTDLTVAAARPGDVVDGPAAVEVVAFEDGEEERTAVPPVFPGVHARTSVSGGDALATNVIWRQAPVAVERAWQLEGDDDLPPGTVAGPCPSTVSDRWVVPGMITVGGSEARLRVANPFRSDATIAVGFVTPEGPEQPLALQNLSVPARGTLEIDVNEVMPERADLSAVVRVLSGRAIVEGYQLTRAAIGDIDGASLLAASTAPAETWTVPWVTDSESDDAWLWVVNLGDRPAPVELTLHTPDGGIAPDGLTEVTVAPGQLRRIDLRGTLPEGVAVAGVTARSEGAPIHVSGAVQRRADDPDGSGFVVQLGVPEAAASWAVTGGAVADGRRERLRVVNRGSEPAELSVALFNGSAASRPSELTDLTIGPGESRQLNLESALAGAPSWSAFVTATSGEVVVGRIGSGGHEDGLHLVAVPGTPAAAWGTPPTGLVSRAAPGTVRRLGTSLGVHTDGFGTDLGRSDPSVRSPSDDETPAGTDDPAPAPPEAPEPDADDLAPDEPAPDDPDQD